MQGKKYGKFCLYLFVSTTLYFSSFSVCLTAPFDSKASYQVYFTPTHNCTTQIINAIHQTRKSIHMQAYSLTSKPIVEALIGAQQRNVAVNIIIDKSNLSGHSQAKLLAQQGALVWVDNLSGLAHNKIIIFDQETVMTGSFNFSYSAQHKNRENILLIQDKNLTARYLENWHLCRQKSTLLKYKPLKSKRSASVPEQVSNSKRIFIGLIAGLAIGTIFVLQ